MSIGLYIVLAPLYLKSVRKLQEKRFVFVKILAIIIPENGAKVSKIKCFQFAQQTLCKLQKEYGFTIVMVTHNLNIAEMANTVIKMNSGKISEIYTNEAQKTAYEIGW